MTHRHGIGLKIVVGMFHAVLPLALVGAVILLVGLVGRLAGKSLVLARIERKRLMTPAEVRFWHVLEAALPEYRVFGQVAMGALLKPVAGLSKKDWWSTFGRFSQKVVDFVVVEAATGNVVAVVELDDHSHDRLKDAARDVLLDRGGYLVVRFGGGGRITAVDVRARFAQRLDLDRPPIAWRPRAVT